MKVLREFTEATVFGFVEVQSVHSASTVVGMHDDVLNEVDARSGRIMELWDAGINHKDTGGGPSDQVFSINSGCWLE